MATTVENNDAVPQWKKDLIARLRSQNKKAQTSQQQQQQRQQQPRRPSPSSAPPEAAATTAPAPASAASAMVQERTWCPPAAPVAVALNGYAKYSRRDADDGSDREKEEEEEDEEDLHYGPGIVHRLRNKYLSLALRETPPRPSVLRRAASLEHLLDDEDAEKRKTRPRSGRFRPAASARAEMKRARSVEAISRLGEDAPDNTNSNSNHRQSLHEEVLRGTKNEEAAAAAAPMRQQQQQQRPKRLTPLVAPSEKPPADFVRQAKMLFEGRTRRTAAATGEVAAKVVEFNSIIVKAKVASKGAKPPTAAKHHAARPAPAPADSKGVVRPISARPKGAVAESPPPSPSPSLPSPIPDVSRADRANGAPSSLSETPDLILTAAAPPAPAPCKRQHLEAFIGEERKASSPPAKVALQNGIEWTRPAPPPPPPPPTEPLRVEVVNGFPERPSPRPLSPRILQAARQLEETTATVAVVAVAEAPVKKPRRRDEAAAGAGAAAVVFNFTGRRDVPDYIANDTSRRPAKPEMPKPGEGGVILLPWAASSWPSNGASAFDEDDEVLRSLEGPPSPCDVTFVNDNVLIDGRSSLALGRRRRAATTKLKISFVDSGPDIFEYPSENSFPEETAATPVVGHSVPTLSGSSLADYIPKTIDGFELGVTRSAPVSIFPEGKEKIAERVLDEPDQPITFSSGSNSDMLF